MAVKSEMCFIPKGELCGKGSVVQFQWTLGAVSMEVQLQRMGGLMNVFLQNNACGCFRNVRRISMNKMAIMMVRK